MSLKQEKYTCVHTHTHTHRHKRHTHTHTHSRAHSHAHTHTHTHTTPHTHTHTQHTHTPHTHTHSLTHTHTTHHLTHYSHTLTHTHSHTHTHTHTHTQSIRGTGSHLVAQFQCTYVPLYNLQMNAHVSNTLSHSLFIYSTRITPFWLFQTHTHTPCFFSAKRNKLFLHVDLTHIHTCSQIPVSQISRSTEKHKVCCLSLLYSCHLQMRFSTAAARRGRDLGQGKYARPLTAPVSDSHRQLSHAELSLWKLSGREGLGSVRQRPQALKEQRKCAGEPSSAQSGTASLSTPGSSQLFNTVKHNIWFNIWHPSVRIRSRVIPSESANRTFKILNLCCQKSYLLWQISDWGPIRLKMA